MKFYVQKKQKSSHSEQYGNGKVTKIITVYVILAVLSTEIEVFCLI